MSNPAWEIERRRRQKNGNRVDREQIALFIGGVLLLAIPALWIAVSGLAMGWLAVLGVAHAHRIIFGWCSTFQDKGWEPSVRLAYEPIGVVSAYLMYQLLELLSFVSAEFKDALSK